uniref:Uncharacterized protein n=1 Tax=Timema poppense TaxID=170557 RepID=A0A7R9GZX5_TIMPO|nr:unnamed protein product [Timema poppensis]
MLESQGQVKALRSEGFLYPPHSSAGFSSTLHPSLILPDPVADSKRLSAYLPQVGLKVSFLIKRHAQIFCRPAPPDLSVDLQTRVSLERPPKQHTRSLPGAFHNQSLYSHLVGGTVAGDRFFPLVLLVIHRLLPGSPRNQWAHIVRVTKSSYVVSMESCSSQHGKEKFDFKGTVPAYRGDSEEIDHSGQNPFYTPDWDLNPNLHVIEVYKVVLNGYVNNPGNTDVIPPTLHRGGHYSPSTLATRLSFSGLCEMANATDTRNSKSQIAQMISEYSNSGDTEMESDTDGQGTFTLATKLNRKRKCKADLKRT